MGVVPISGALPDRIGLSLIFPSVAKRSNDGLFFQFTPDLSCCPDVLSVRRLLVKPAERVTGLYRLPLVARDAMHNLCKFISAQLPGVVGPSCALRMIAMSTRRLDMAGDRYVVVVTVAVVADYLLRLSLPTTTAIHLRETGNGLVVRYQR